MLVHNKSISDFKCEMRLSNYNDFNNHHNDQHNWPFLWMLSENQIKFQGDFGFLWQNKSFQTLLFLEIKIKNIKKLCKSD